MELLWREEMGLDDMEDVVMVDVEELEDDIIDVETLEEVTGSEDKTVT